MMVVSVGFSNGIITILCVILIILLMKMIRKKNIFKLLAIINKVILPSLIAKDLSKLKGYEKIILVYRYWVTRNSL